MGEKNFFQVPKLQISKFKLELMLLYMYFVFFWLKVIPSCYLHQ